MINALVLLAVLIAGIVFVFAVVVFFLVMRDRHRSKHYKGYPQASKH
jgi:hypothetical protein